MNIAMFIEVYHPFINGVVTHVSMLRDSLIRQGHKVLIVTADPDLKHHRIRDGILWCPAVSLKKIYGYGLAAPLSSHRMKLLRAFQPDIIHIHNEFGVSLFGVYAAHKLRLPLVYTLHTMYDEYFHYMVKGKMTPVAKQTFYKYIRFLANRADVIISPSKKAVKFFEECRVNKAVEIIPNTIDINTFNPQRFSDEETAAKRAEWNVAPTDLLGVFVGRLGQEKSVDYLIEQWNLFFQKEPRYKLLIVGEGPERKPLEKLAESYGLASRILFSGKIEHAEVPLYFASCDYFISASLTEMMSISMLEAQSMGLPAILRFDPQNEQQIREGINGHLFHDGEEMAQTVRRLGGLSRDEIHTLHEGVRTSMLHAGSDENVSFILSLYERAAENYKARHPSPTDAVQK